MTSCWYVPEPEVEFDETNLLGLWAKTSTNSITDTVPVEFVRFTNEMDENDEYKYGREWNESEDVYEEDLKPYGNGWFKYKLVQRKLTVIHLMDNNGANIPQVYNIIKLTPTELQYKDDFARTKTFIKIR